MATLAELVAAQKAKKIVEENERKTPVESKTDASAAPASFSIRGTQEQTKNDKVTEIKPSGGFKISVFGKQPDPQTGNLAINQSAVETKPALVSDETVSSMVPTSANGDIVLTGEDIVLETGEEQALKEFNHSQMTDLMMPADEEGFRQTVAILHNVFDNVELVMTATKNILRSLRDNPQFVKFLVPEDCGMMVRALRQSYGIVASSKTVKKETKAKKQDTIDDVAAQIGNLLG